MSSKVREGALRRQLDRLGYKLMKSHARDPNDLTYGGYQIIDVQTNGLVGGWGNANSGFGFDLDDVETWLRQEQASDESGAP